MSAHCPQRVTPAVPSSATERKENRMKPLSIVVSWAATAMTLVTAALAWLALDLWLLGCVQSMLGLR